MSSRILESIIMERKVFPDLKILDIETSENLLFFGGYYGDKN